MQNIINSFPSISLTEMAGVELMKRIDTKFVIHQSSLLSLLEEIKGHYNVLEINRDRVMTYQTLYFDTRAKKFYYDHHNGRTRREKVRIRKYVESGRCFLEIKQKDPKGRTHKSRKPIPDVETELSVSSLEFIRETIRQDYELSPTIGNRFNRVTLVNTCAKERVTIDCNLWVEKGERVKSYGNLVILEVKQEQFNRDSPIVRVLRKYRHHPYRISKYCIGMISIYSDLKYNEFKRKRLKIQRVGA